MKLKNMLPEELEMMSYTDLTYCLLKENNKPMNTPTIFKEICNLLNYSDSEYEDKIGDYYTSLTIDKRFILLDSNEWDIRDKHAVKIVLDDEDEEEVEDIIEEDEDEEVVFEDEEEEIDEVVDDDLDDSDMEDLTIVDGEEELSE